MSALSGLSATAAVRQVAAVVQPVVMATRVVEAAAEVLLPGRVSVQTLYHLHWT